MYCEHCLSYVIKIYYIFKLDHTCLHNLVVFFPISCSIFNLYYELYRIDHYINIKYISIQRLKILKKIKKYTSEVLIFESVPQLFGMDCHPWLAKESHRKSLTSTPASSSSSTLIVVRFFAKRFALMAAIFSADMVSLKDLNKTNLKTTLKFISYIKQLLNEIE